MPRCWQQCQRRLAPSRPAGSPCLEAGWTGVRGATEYISGRGFVITALPVLATNHDEFVYARQRCRVLRFANWFARLTSEMTRRIVRSTKRTVHGVFQDRTRRVSRSRLRGFASVGRECSHSGLISGRTAARNASVRGSSVFLARDQPTVSFASTFEVDCFYPTESRAPAGWSRARKARRKPVRKFSYQPRWAHHTSLRQS